MTTPNVNGIGSLASTGEGRRVYVIDDDIGVRRSLHFLLTASSISAWPFSSGEDFIEQLPGLVPAPILLDVRMPGIDGIQLLVVIKELAVHWPIIMMTAHGEVSIAVSAMKLGAIEFLEKPFRAEMLDQVLALAFDQSDQDVQTAHERDVARSTLARLSKREKDVIALLMTGALNKTVAYRLGLSPRTVEMHRCNALEKLGKKSIAEVLLLAVTAGFDPPTIALDSSSS